MARQEQRIPKRDLKRLIHKSMKGDIGSFTRLYGLFVKTIYYNASLYLYDKNNLDDVVQEIAIVLYKNIARLKSAHSFYAYLYQVTKNVCRDFNRKAGKHNSVDLDTVEYELVDDRNHTPSEALEAKDLKEQVQRLVSKLPEKQREVLQLYYYDNLSYKEIAKITGTKAGTVGANISRAKESMKALIKEESARAVARDKGQSHHGTAFDVLIASAIASDINSALSDDKASLLLNNCNDLVAQTALTTGKAVVVTGVAKAALMGAGALAVAGVVGVSALQGISSEMYSHVAVAAGENAFNPDIVQIEIECQHFRQAVAINPLRARLQLSEGVSRGWLILDETDTAVASGDGMLINAQTFSALSVGEYRIEWTVSDDDGLSGVVSGSFEIEGKDELQPA